MMYVSKKACGHLPLDFTGTRDNSAGLIHRSYTIIKDNLCAPTLYFRQSIVQYINMQQWGSTLRIPATEDKSMSQS